MKFELKKASDLNYREEIEINTLEELKEFQQKCCDAIIVDFNDPSSEPSIIIYDYYLE